MKKIKVFNHLFKLLHVQRWMIVIWGMALSHPLSAQKTQNIKVLDNAESIGPLDQIEILSTMPGILSIKDAAGRTYYESPTRGSSIITVTGKTGEHTILLSDKKKNILASSKFAVKTETKIDDGATASEMFNLFYEGMLVYDDDGTSEITWNDKTYRYFVEWVLDNNNTAKGMQYFSPYSRDLVDLLCENQQDNGMIWSFVNKGDAGSHYYNTAYSPIHYFHKDNEVWFVRQPAENHVEYNFVNMMYQHWKASGDNEWMKAKLVCAARALDYAITDSVRWSKRFHLLKRPYCIDSWDFQVDDEYTPPAPISPTMVIVPGKTKYGVFFGDNTGYYDACNQLAEMLDFDGQKEQAAAFRKRGGDILSELMKLSWNGRFFTHFIDEDPNVIRDLGVDEKSQIAQGNMYSINRGLPHDINVSIIKTYLELKQNLPVGSPGEWYAIYPPFEKGFGSHNQKWQYMNGGVAAHAAGELARGCYENGYENYGSEILYKLYSLGKENGSRIWFAYTGSIPPPPPPANFKILDISEQMNMDLWDKGGKGSMPWMNTTREGNDMRGLPTGAKTFENIPYNVVDPDKNQRRSVIGLSVKPGLPAQIEIPVNDSAATIYLLHSSSDNIPSNVAGAITFRYTDGSEASQYLMKGKDVTNWWFSDLKNDHSGIAWWGPNLCSTKVGICWAAINNPYPLKKIDKLYFHAPIEGGIYALLAVTLADRQHYIKPPVESYGGPDNWAAANAMAALVEGLAGIKNNGLAFDDATVSPRWISAGIDSINVTVQLSASGEYVSYKYRHLPSERKIYLTLTGSGNKMNIHAMLPAGFLNVESVIADGKHLQFKLSVIEKSIYADFNINLPKVHTICLTYTD